MELHRKRHFFVTVITIRLVFVLVTLLEVIDSGWRHTNWSVREVIKSAETLSALVTRVCHTANIQVFATPNIVAISTCEF